MSITICLVAVVLLEGCLSAALPSPTKNLLAPNLRKTDVYNDHIVLTWQPVAYDENNPLLGYKVKLWEEEKKQVFYFDEVDGVKQLVSKYETVDMDPKKVPNTVPVVVTVGRNETKAIIPDIKLHVQYQLRVQAFYKNGDGPYSSPTGIKLGNDE